MRIIAISVSSATALAVACHGSSRATAPDAEGADAAASADAANLMRVEFAFAPSWADVSSVDVIGGFGRAGDWTTPLLSLTAGSNGTFGGAAELPPGTYPYLFRVVGDAAAGSGSATYSRYAVDGAVSEYEACPAGPTAGADPNPCSLVTVPQGALETTYTVKGSVAMNGSAAARYLVVLERDEAGSHPYFVNRRATGAAGTYQFTVAPGTYRVQVQNPDYLSKKDAQLAPQTVDTVRRDLSAAFAVAADVTVSTADVTPPDYATFEPRTTATLPTTFAFPATLDATLDVYGAGAEIEDPWFTAAATATGSASFEGAFTAPAAGSDAVNPADTYSWGIEWAIAGSGAVRWTGQSLVYPIAWPN